MLIQNLCGSDRKGGCEDGKIVSCSEVTDVSWKNSTNRTSQEEKWNHTPTMPGELGTNSKSETNDGSPKTSTNNQVQMKIDPET